MTEYNFSRTVTLPYDVAAKKAARKKVIEKARQLERESYRARMRKLHRLQASSDML